MKDIIKKALKEDIGSGDITTNCLIPKDAFVVANIIAKESGVIAGLNAAKKVFKQVDLSIKFVTKLRDGSLVKSGNTVAVINGAARSILTAERVALNFLQRLSGIATLTNKFVSKIKRTKATILATRKTVPGLREEEKKAVVAGGGFSHRMGLYDAILIKDNHLAIVGDIAGAVRKAKKIGRVEVEAKSLSQVEEAVKAGANTIMLDNMNIATIKKAVGLIRARDKKFRRRTSIEASGGITLKNVLSVAKTGVDFISVGALTHSSKALDISLDIIKKHSTAKFAKKPQSPPRAEQRIQKI